MRSLVIVVCVVILQGVSAWPWSSRPQPVSRVPSGVISAQVPHTIAECANALQLGEQGNCMFYRCLEDRFRCSPDGYTVNISQHFCDKIDRGFSQFDADGQIWLTETSICLMSCMLDIYSSETTTCEAIKTAGIEGILSCNDRTVRGTQRDITFCDFISTNGGRYSDLMGMAEINKLRSLNNPTILRSMVYQGYQCGAQMLEEAVNSIFDSITQTGRRLLDRTANFFGFSS